MLEWKNEGMHGTAVMIPDHTPTDTTYPGCYAPNHRSLKCSDRPPYIPYAHRAVKEAYFEATQLLDLDLVELQRHAEIQTHSLLNTTSNSQAPAV